MVGALFKLGVANSYIGLAVLCVLVLFIVSRTSLSKAIKIQVGAYGGVFLNYILHYQANIPVWMLALFAVGSIAVLVGYSWVTSGAKWDRMLLKNKENKYEKIKVLFVEKALYERQCQAKTNLLKELQRWTPDLGFVIVGVDPFSLRCADFDNKYPSAKHKDSFLYDKSGLRILVPGVMSAMRVGKDLDNIEKWMGFNCADSTWFWVGHSELDNPKGLASVMQVPPGEVLSTAQAAKIQMSLFEKNPSSGPHK